MSKITLITPTRYRSKCFSILAECLANQDFQDDVQWIAVCDGGADKYTVPSSCEFYTRDPSADGDRPSICQNYLEGLKHAKHDRVLFVEDDEIYHRHYLKTFDRWLDDHDMVAESNAHYYNVSFYQYAQLQNENGSLCQTGVKGEALDYFKHTCETWKDCYIDIAIWTYFEGSKKWYPYEGCVVSTKQAWADDGHRGYGIGHQQGIGPTDWGDVILDKWFGEYAHYFK